MLWERQHHGRLGSRLADDKPHIVWLLQNVADTMGELALKYPSYHSEQARVPEYLEMIKAARIKEEELSSSV